MRKRRKRIKRIIVRLIVFIIVLILIGILGYGLIRWVSQAFFHRIPAQEDEKLHLSPPNEEILFVRFDEGIFITDPQGRNIRQLTNANDLAPSWKADGSGFYFLRLTANRELHLLFYDYIQGQLSESAVQTFSSMEIPNPENDFIKISPDGNRIAISSYDWGIQIMELSTKRVISRSFLQCWDFWDLMSRNSKFVLLATRPHSRAMRFVSGGDEAISRPGLWLAETNMQSMKRIDESALPFQGMSFSRNGYTFAYSKEGYIYYVDSIQEIQPSRVTEGVFPAIRPLSDPKKYPLLKPFWADFDLSNLVAILSWDHQSKGYMVLATPNHIALVDLEDQRLDFYTEGKKKERHLGWKLMDFFLADINGNQERELIASWWPGGEMKGAERISIFAFDSSGKKIKEVFKTYGKYQNTLQIFDLNGDGFKDLLNMYSDVSGEGNEAMDALIWTDVYTWDGQAYQLSNERFADLYRELVESYRIFLAQALRQPDLYGNRLYIIRDLLNRANAILDQD